MIEDWSQDFDDDELPGGGRKALTDPAAATVKRRLREFLDLGTERDILLDRYTEARAKAESASSPSFDRSYSTSGDPQSPTERNVIRIMELEEQIRENLEEEKRARQQLEILLHRIGKAEERGLIRCRYIDAEKWEDVARIIYGRRSDYKQASSIYMQRTYKLHGEAMRSMARAAEQTWPEFVDESLTFWEAIAKAPGMTAPKLRAGGKRDATAGGEHATA